MFKVYQFNLKEISKYLKFYDFFTLANTSNNNMI